MITVGRITENISSSSNMTPHVVRFDALFLSLGPGKKIEHFIYKDFFWTPNAIYINLFIHYKCLRIVKIEV